MGRNVYIIGAGFSRSLGYPLAAELLPGVWDRLSSADHERLGKIIAFHHPTFDPDDSKSFPALEPLLTAMAVNEELFHSSRNGVGNFTLNDLRNARKLILLTIEQWFHDIYRETKTSPAWLNRFKKRLVAERATVISFNWDLVLDHLFFSGNLSAECYGFRKSPDAAVVLLKPHGSLNWFGDVNATKIKEKRRVQIYEKKASHTTYYAFLRARSPISTHGQIYEPLLIPPTYMKKFDKPIFRKLWNECVDVLSIATDVYFLGYSMPDEDRHAQFILHCGFHNQIDGKLKRDGERTKPTGYARVIIVNPDSKAAKRIQKVIGPTVEYDTIKKSIDEWISQQSPTKLGTSKNLSQDWR